ncbi:MAG: hypothetical protein R3E96_05390 [Planctomycetota bacterium]
MDSQGESIGSHMEDPGSDRLPAGSYSLEIYRYAPTCPQPLDDLECNAMIRARFEIRPGEETAVQMERLGYGQLRLTLVGALTEQDRALLELCSPADWFQRLREEHDLLRRGLRSTPPWPVRPGPKDGVAIADLLVDGFPETPVLWGDNSSEWCSFGAFPLGRTTLTGFLPAGPAALRITLPGGRVFEQSVTVRTYEATDVMIVW